MPPESLTMPTVKRIPMYYRVLEQLKKDGREHVSSETVSRMLNLEPIVVRKDMARIGVIGRPRIGFVIQETLDCISSIMHSNNPNDAFLVGMGNLGQALMGYKGFVKMGLNIVAGFDSDPAKIGKKIHDKEIFDVVRLPKLTKSLNIQTGILCVSEQAAQSTADLMVEAGIKGIWNFTPVALQVPDNIVIQREDLAEGWAVLTVKLSKLKQED